MLCHTHLLLFVDGDCRLHCLVASCIRSIPQAAARALGHAVQLLGQRSHEMLCKAGGQQLYESRAAASTGALCLSHARTCIVLDWQLALWQLVQQQALDAHLLLRCCCCWPATSSGRLQSRD